MALSGWSASGEPCCSSTGRLPCRAVNCSSALPGGTALCRKHPATFGSSMTRPAGMRGFDHHRLAAALVHPDASSDASSAGSLPRIALLKGCTHGRQAVSHPRCALCRLRPTGLPPGTPLQMTCCVVCDQQLKALVADVGASRPPGQAGTTSTTGKLLGCAHVSGILQPTAQ